MTMYRCQTTGPNGPEEIVEAHQWFKNGDHPLDRVGETETDPVSGQSYTILEGRIIRFFRRPDQSGDAPCPICGNPNHDHGWVDGQSFQHRVCPGDYVVSKPNRVGYFPAQATLFERLCKPVEGS